VSHNSVNTSRAENFMRSAMAPTMRAGVMIAKVIWNITNTASGIVPCTVAGASPASIAWPRPPTNECSPVLPAAMPASSKATE